MNTLFRGAGAVAGMNFLGSAALGSKSRGSKDYRFDLGCFTRPWRKLPLETAFDGIAAAGFSYVGLMVEREPEMVLRPTLAEEYRDIRKKLRDRGLVPVMALIRPDLSKPPKEAAKLLVPLMDVLQEIGIRYLLDLATWVKEYYGVYYEVMKWCADAARKHDQQIVVKPHIGKWETGEQLAEAVKAVGSEAYRICYDPGNILFYSYRRDHIARDAVRELEVCLPWVTAMCVKDCRTVGLEKGDVWISPGNGEVDFPGIFNLLKKARFQGPCVVETLGGKTPDEVNREATRTFVYLSRLTA